MARPDYYEILGVGRGATVEDVKAAHRQLVKRFHPDSNPDDPFAEERFELISAAYQTLVTPDSRARYDAQFPPEAKLSRTLGKLVKRKAKLRVPSRGADARAHITLTFSESLSGTSKPLSYAIAAPCAACDGSGAKFGSDMRVCDACHGEGKDPVLPVACYFCEGTGAIVVDPCEECQGSGAGKRRQRVRLNVPSAIQDGARLKVAGKGDIGRHGGQPGDLIVSVEVEPPELFSIVEGRLLMNLPIGIDEAILGAQVTVPTIDSVREVQVPPGSPHGAVMRLVDGAGPGIDLHYRLEVIVPNDLSAQQRELLESFVSSLDDNYDPRASLRTAIADRRSPPEVRGDS